MGPRTPRCAWSFVLAAFVVGSRASDWCGCPSASTLRDDPHAPTLAPPVHATCQDPGGGGGTRACQAFELPYPNQQPLDVDAVRRARAHVGDAAGLRRTLCAAAGGKTLHVVVAGGSVTAGTHCQDPHAGTRDIDCGWPARFAVWLDGAFPLGAPHRVENLSERASSSLVATELLAPHRTRLSGVDLFILDYAVNDASNVQIKPHFRRTTERAEQEAMAHHGNLSSSASTSGVGGVGDAFCSSLSGEYRDKLLIATERLVRWCISLPSRPAILFFDTFNPRVGWQKQAQEVHLTVASYYQLPVVSYRDAVWHRWRELGSEAHGQLSSHDQRAAEHSAASSSLASPGSGASASLGLKAGLKAGLDRRRGAPDHRGGSNGGADGAAAPAQFGRHGKRKHPKRGLSAEADPRSRRVLLSSSLSSSVSSSLSSPLSSSSSSSSAAVSPLCESLGLQPHCADAFWSRSLHPPWFVHQLLADLLGLSLADEHRRHCADAAGDHSPTQRKKNAWSDALAAVGATSTATPAATTTRVRPLPPLFGTDGGGASSADGGDGAVHCSAPLSVMSTLRTAAAANLKPLPPAPGLSHSGWALEEDVPGKPGWVAPRSGGGAELSFDLAFERGDLVVGFLRSYSGLGLCEVWLSAAESGGGAGAGGPGGQLQPGRLSAKGQALAKAPLVLDGLWDERKSELAKHQLSGLGHGRLRVHFRSMCHADTGDCKFKLLLLMSC